VIIHLKARFGREAIDRRCVGQKIKLQVGATVFRCGTKQLAWHHNRRFAMKFDDFRNRVRVPFAKLLGYKISVLTATFCHD